MDSAMDRQVSMGDQVGWTGAWPEPVDGGPGAVGSTLARSLARAEVLSGAERVPVGVLYTPGAKLVPRLWAPGELSANLARGRAALRAAVDGVREQGKVMDGVHRAKVEAQAAHERARVARLATENLLAALRGEGDLGAAMARMTALFGAEVKR